MLLLTRRGFVMLVSCTRVFSDVRGKCIACNMLDREVECLSWQFSDTVKDLSVCLSVLLSHGQLRWVYILSFHGYIGEILLPMAPVMLKKD